MNCRFYVAVRVPGRQSPAMILDGWTPPDSYHSIYRWPVWMHRLTETAAEAITACQDTPNVLDCLVERRPSGSLIWPRGDGLDAAAVTALYDKAAADARQKN